MAYGLKLSVDAGFNGDVTLDAKTPDLATHYEREPSKRELQLKPVCGFFDETVSA